MYGSTNAARNAIRVYSQVSLPLEACPCQDVQQQEIPASHRLATLCWLHCVKTTEYLLILTRSALPCVTRLSVSLVRAQIVAFALSV